MARKTTYYGSRISDNMVKTPEGFLICRNVPIARLGKQQYLGVEIGLQDRDVHDVERVEQEVFSPAAIASFEGKPFTNEHPISGLTPDNASTYTKGTISNVRRGAGTDDAYLMADIIVYDSTTIREIENGKREISCGYDCCYEETEGGYRQTGIVGNHVALVAKGRAGNRIAIKDNKMKEVEYMPKNKHSRIWAKVLGLVKDNEPEALEEAVDAMIDSCNNVANIMQKPQEDEEPPKQQAPAPQPAPQAPPMQMPQQAPAPAPEPEANNEEQENETKHLQERIARLERLLSRFAKGETEDPEESQDSFEELEGELSEDEDMPEEEPEEFEEGDEGDEYEDEESEVIEQEDEGEEMPEGDLSAADSLELIRVLKPAIANIRNGKKRKRATDALAYLIRKQMGMGKGTSGNYAAIKQASMKHAADHAAEDLSELGKQWARKYNPHYKKR